MAQTIWGAELIVIDIPVTCQRWNSRRLSRSRCEAGSRELPEVTSAPAPCQFSGWHEQRQHRSREVAQHPALCPDIRALPKRLALAHNWDPSGAMMFSPDYLTARASFREVARRLGWFCHSVSDWSHRTERRGFDDRRGDVIPAWTAQVLVISSGLHGVEGFYGSAIQLALLNNGIARGAHRRDCVARRSMP